MVSISTFFYHAPRFLLTQINQALISDYYQSFDCYPVVESLIAIIFPQRMA